MRQASRSGTLPRPRFSGRPSPAAREGATTLLLECMLGIAEGRPRLAALAKAGVDWERLLDLARDHAVAETVHHALASRGVDGHAPAEVRSALRDAHLAATARNALLLAEASRVQGALAEAGIRSALVKGAALVAAHYPAIGARYVADLDVLLRAEQVERGVEVVRELGAVPIAPQAEAGSPGAELAATAKHAPVLVLPSGLCVELHRRFGADQATGAATEAIVGRSREVSWGEHVLRVASTSDLLGVACHHVLVGHAGRLQYRPRHLADTAVLLAAGADVTRAASLPGAAEPVRVSIKAADDPDPADHLVTALGEIRGRLVTALRGGPAKGLRQVFLPGPDFMAWRYGVPRRSPLLPLTYLWRPLRGAWRVLTGR